MTADNVIDNDVGGQVEQEVSGKSTRKLDPGFRRNLFVIAGVVGVILLVTIVSLLWSSSSSQDKKTSAVAITQPTAPISTDESRLSPEMRAALAVKQREEAEKAKGGVYVPPESISDIKPLDQSRSATAANGVGTNPNPMVPGSGGAGAPPADPMYLETLQRRREGVQRQLLGIVAGMEIADPVRVDFSSNSSAGAGQATPGNGAGTSGAQQVASAASSTTQAGSTGRQLIGAYEVFAGETSSPMDSYKTTYISSELNSGKLAGASLYGTVTVNDEGAGMQFAGMRWNGKACRINARGLDEKTATDALDVNIDRRYLERWVWPVITAGVGAAASLKAQRQQQIIGLGNTNDPAAGAVGVNVGAATRAQVAAAAVAGGVQILQREADRAAAKPPQFTWPARSPLGVIFLAPVNESDCQ